MSVKPTDPEVHQYQVTWEEYNSDIHTLAQILSNHRFTGIIPIVRGGLVIATHLSSLLKIPQIQVDVNKINGGLWLVVDDVSDTGRTLTNFVKKIKKGYIVVATLHRKDNTIFEPNYCIRTINKWIVYPWEV